jgi:hypothetical protein
VDAAVDMARDAVGRRNLSDIVNLVAAHEEVLPLGAIVWAAAPRMIGFTPEGMIARIRRNSLYPMFEWRALTTSRQIAPAIVYSMLRTACDQAEAFVTRMPTDKVGLLFLKDGKVVQPDPDKLDEYQTHAGKRRGHWPSNSEIETAMLEHYNLRPKP